MSLEASSLTIQVISQGIQDATKALNDLAAAGEKAESKTSNIGSGAQQSAKAQVDAAQQAASSYNAIIDMMTEKSNTFYADKAMKAAIASQQEVFDGMALADKLVAITQQSQADRAAMRDKESADIRAKQQQQMQAAQAWYAAQQEMANKMNAIYDKKQASSLANDHEAAIIEDKRRALKALTQAQTEAIAINERMIRDDQQAKKEADAFVEALKRRAETVGMSSQQLREYDAQQVRNRATQLWLMQAGSDSAKQIEGYIKTLQNAKGAHEGFSFATAGSAR